MTCTYSIKYAGQVVDLPSQATFESTGPDPSDTQKLKIHSLSNDFYFAPGTVGHPMTTNGRHPVSYQATCNFGNGLTKTAESLFEIIVEPLITEPDNAKDIMYAIGGTAQRPIYNFERYVKDATNYDLHLHIGGVLHTNGNNGISASKTLSVDSNYLELTVDTNLGCKC